MLTAWHRRACIVARRGVARGNAGAATPQLLAARHRCLGTDATQDEQHALAIVEAAAKSGKLQAGGVVVEAASGSLGVALAAVCAKQGYQLVATMSASFAPAERAEMRAQGAKVIVTPALLGGAGMLSRAEDLARLHGWPLARWFACGPKLAGSVPNLRRCNVGSRSAADFASTGMISHGKAVAAKAAAPDYSPPQMWHPAMASPAEPLSRGFDSYVQSWQPGAMAEVFVKASHVKLPHEIGELLDFYRHADAAESREGDGGTEPVIRPQPSANLESLFDVDAPIYVKSSLHDDVL